MSDQASGYDEEEKKKKAAAFQEMNFFANISSGKIQKKRRPRKRNCFD